MIVLRRKPGAILSLSQATAQILLGALLILSSSSSSHSSPGSLIVVADASKASSSSSLFDSLTSFIRTTNANNRYHFRGSNENQQEQEEDQLLNFNILRGETMEKAGGEEQLVEDIEEEDGHQDDNQKGALASILDSVYSFAAKKVSPKNTPAPKVHQASNNKDKDDDDEEEEQHLRFQYQGTSRHLGQWDLVGVSGVSAMHATLIPNTNKIVFLEKVEKNTHASLPENAAKLSFTVEYDIEESTFRPLHTPTNQFCSAGGYRPDGTIVSVGGAEAQKDVVEGWNSLRFLSSCNATNSRCDWDVRKDITLKAGRWYPTVETLADGTLFILGGSTRGASVNDKEISVPSWELYPPLPSNPTHFQFLEETLPFNLYPIVHLLPDGNLFIFANTRGIIFSTKTWSIIKNLPVLPGPPRNYPLSGGSVLLPLRPEHNYEPEVLICGGATEFSSRAKGQTDCGRIFPLREDADWVMENMPLGRMMPDLTLLPDGSVMMFNGANHGTAGYGRNKNPVLIPVRYKPWDSKEKSRFTKQNPSYIPRLYHSVAMPVLDGRVMVAGSNPNANTLEWSEFPVEYRVEMFTPGYMLTDTPRPLLKAESTIGRTISRPQALPIQVLQETNANPERGQGDGDTTENVILFDTVIEVERLVGLEVVGYVPNREGGLDRLKVKGPRDGALTPPGWYQMTVVENGIPSEGIWVRVQ
ncbi:hypothetical protein BGZ97_002010 [Linnemannia gamsii]|uniref:Galactose oxidase n=1 Tax=Linnemannia gamsii TaxID=64522 RepID=A0A9P6UIU9_9FUNG|nr:hypothetical protein BGZ97_002010 [Linnemannia gamsii]